MEQTLAGRTRIFSMRRSRLWFVDRMLSQNSRILLDGGQLVVDGPLIAGEQFLHRLVGAHERFQPNLEVLDAKKALECNVTIMPAGLSGVFQSEN